MNDQFTTLTGIRQHLFMDRYSLKNSNGEPVEQYPEQMWKRVSWALAQIEKTSELRMRWEGLFYEAIKDFKFCPAGRFLTSAGTGTETTMINCFVIPSPEDTRKGIMETLGWVTEISARGGGVGFNLSSLRPRGTHLKQVNGTTSGPVSWANLYSVAAHDVIQQGGSRRGALMIMLWDWHPDIEEFILEKKKPGRILGANLSVCVSDAFMEAVKNDWDWELKYPDTEFAEYRTPGKWQGDLETWIGLGYPVKKYKTIKARYLWDLICESAWGSAEPGVVFMDRYNKMNNTWYFEKNIATNPCGEQGLPAWGVCNLSSINLSALVNEGKFDFHKFEDMIRVGIRFLDNAVDAEKYLNPEIEKMQQRERRVGLGTIGLADALIKMKIRYGSKESLDIIEKIFKLLRDVSYLTSIELAQEKGSFPAFDAEKFLQSGFMQTMPEEIRNKIRQFGLRNALLLTEAPTGKISLLAGVSSGIEPVFSFSYIQRDRLGERTMYHPLYQEWLKNNTGQEIPRYFVVADDLTPEEHVRIQALIQKYTDSSISKTVNAPQKHTIEDVKNLYQLAYETGCKGISYMREGSREGTLVRKTEEEKKPETVVWQRPMKISGSTYKLKTPVGTAFITINHDDGGSPVELFINIGRAGSDIQAMAEALGRVISKSLKMMGNTSPKERSVVLVEQLQGIGGTRTTGFGVDKVLSLPDAVARVLVMDLGLARSKDRSDKQLELVKERNLEESVMRKADICPNCGNVSLVHEMGCKTCYGCGYSEC
jgi:ribonucleoside-diphosphate reductase alpha chain